MNWLRRLWRDRPHVHSWRYEVSGGPFLGNRYACSGCWARQYRRGLAIVTEDNEGWRSSPPLWLQEQSP